MTAQSIVHYVNVNVVAGGTGTTPAGFGTPIFVSQHAITANRLDGPFTSAQAILDAGFSSGSPQHSWASSVFSQRRRVRQVYLGRQDAGDADLTEALNAIYAVDPGAWYGMNMEYRDAANIKLLAAFAETVPKLAIVQSNDPSLLSGAGPEFEATFGGTPTDGNYVTTFTGFGLGAPVAVTTIRAAGTPATNDDLATQHAADITTLIGTTLAGVVASASAVGSVVTVVLENDLVAGTYTVSNNPGGSTLDIGNTDDDLGSDLNNLNYSRTALYYHPTDSEYLDAAVISDGLGANLDQRQTSWAFRRFIGVPATSLTDAQVTALRNVNANYYAPAVSSAGTAINGFSAQGWTFNGQPGAGQRIRTTTTLDWYKARVEEALINVLLKAPNGVDLDDPGIKSFEAAVQGVNDTGVGARHFRNAFPVPDGEGDENFPDGSETPAVVTPTEQSLTAPERAAGEFTITSLAYELKSIDKVNLTANVRT